MPVSFQTVSIYTSYLNGNYKIVLNKAPTGSCVEEHKWSYNLLNRKWTSHIFAWCTDKFYFRSNPNLDLPPLTLEIVYRNVLFDCNCIAPSNDSSVHSKFRHDIKVHRQQLEMSLKKNRQLSIRSLAMFKSFLRAIYFFFNFNTKKQMFKSDCTIDPRKSDVMHILFVKFEK